MAAPRALALAAILLSKVANVAPTRWAMAMLIASAVRNVRSRRRRNRVAVVTSAGAISVRAAARSVHASKSSRICRAALVVSWQSPHALGKRRGEFSRREVAYKDVCWSTPQEPVGASGQCIGRKKETERSRRDRSSPRFLVAQPAEKRSGIFFSRALPPPRYHPIHVGRGDRTWCWGYRSQFHNWPTVTGNGYALAAKSAIDQLRQLILCFGNAVYTHRANIAIGWLYCQHVRIAMSSSGLATLRPWCRARLAPPALSRHRSPADRQWSAAWGVACRRAEPRGRCRGPCDRGSACGVAGLAAPPSGGWSFRRASSSSDDLLAGLRVSRLRSASIALMPAAAGDLIGRVPAAPGLRRQRIAPASLFRRVRLSEEDEVPFTTWPRRSPLRCGPAAAVRRTDRRLARCAHRPSPSAVPHSRCASEDRRRCPDGSPRRPADLSARSSALASMRAMGSSLTARSICSSRRISSRKRAASSKSRSAAASRMRFSRSAMVALRLWPRRPAVLGEAGRHGDVVLLVDRGEDVADATS